MGIVIGRAGITIKGVSMCELGFACPKKAGASSVLDLIFSEN